MMNNLKNRLKKVKSLNFTELKASLAIVKEYKKDRISRYDIKYVQISSKLERRLKNIFSKTIEVSNSIEEYSFDCMEPEEDLIRSLESKDTDFDLIKEKLNGITPEEDIINSVKELMSAKAYIIVLRSIKNIELIGYKVLPESWKLKKTKGLIPLLYNENRFDDIDEDNNVFNISSSIDFFYYENFLFILSKKNFELGLNFRNGMIKKAQNFYIDVKSTNYFKNIELLEQRVSNNQRYLRKVAIIMNLGHYKNPEILKRLKVIHSKKNWGLIFEGDQIVITEDTIENVLTVLQNKRLFSELTEEDFDVESAKKYGDVKNSSFKTKQVAVTAGKYN